MHAYSHGILRQKEILFLSKYLVWCLFCLSAQYFSVPMWSISGRTLCRRAALTPTLSFPTIHWACWNSDIQLLKLVEWLQKQFNWDGMPDPVACKWMRTGPETGELGTHGCLSHSLAVQCCSQGVSRGSYVWSCLESGGCGVLCILDPQRGLVGLTLISYHIPSRP